MLLKAIPHSPLSYNMHRFLWITLNLFTKPLNMYCQGTYLSITVNPHTELKMYSF